MIALYHFNRVAYYGLVANLVAVPLTGFWIMPWAVIACALMPFGLDALALTPMGWGVEIVLRIAEAVSSWKGAVGVVPAMPPAGILLIAGGLWLCLWQRPWRLFGILGIAAGLLTIPLASRPDILVSGTGELMAVRLADNRLGLSTTRRERFTAEIWLRRNGQAEPLAWTEAPGAPLSCDALGCIYHVADETVALVRDGRALADDCRTATVVVSAVPVRGRCPSARLVVDRFALWRAGAHAIRLVGGRADVETVADDIGRRPWTPFRERR